MTDNKRVWLFREGNADMRDLLGGKGANLAEMTNAGLPVPPGLTITTETCMEYINNGNKMPEGLMDEVKTLLKDVENQTGKKFGCKENPLLVSVRSGAKLSMPGMMETILNLGLNDETLQGMINLTNNERFCYDSYRRFLTMFGSVAWGIFNGAVSILDNCRVYIYLCGVNHTQDAAFGFGWRAFVCCGYFI